MEFDNTNRVSMFQPRDKKDIMFDGTINCDGTDVKAIIVKATSRDGKPYRNVYISAGPIYLNEIKKAESNPDVGGNINLLGVSKKIGLWWKDYVDKVSGETKQMLSGNLKEDNRDYLNGASDAGRNEYRDAKNGTTPQITQAEVTQQQPTEEDLNDEIPF
tara:strand:+ start:3311 stop:3790 length:480 start_codon:yes stop_codon:yes gene_type:complete